MIFGHLLLFAVQLGTAAHSAWNYCRFESRAARELRKRCETAGLRAVFSPCQAVNHCLINEQTKIFFLIEDHSIGEMVAEEAIRQGLPLRHSTP